MAISFNRDHQIDYGVIEELGPSLRRVTAPNPSAFTFRGTGTYIVGRGNVAIVDPGPSIQSHVDALVEALSAETITHILITHTHEDHSPACKLLRSYTDAPTFGFGPHAASLRINGLMADEGGDMEFDPDVTIGDGDIVEGLGWSLECIHTPGHTSNHLCFANTREKYLLCGDHVMGWSTSIISPPDGDMGDYMMSLNKLLDRDEQTYWPTHGGPIYDPKSFVRGYIQHRRQREHQVLACVESGLSTISDMLPVVYADIDQQLYPAAKRSIFATVLYLVEKGELKTSGEPLLNAAYSIV